ncbi:hypothetical protein RGT18_03280 [Solobacterium moorei]|nr:hypothetical protein RGT18_03280 [Solobacterium moorei]
MTSTYGDDVYAGISDSEKDASRFTGIAEKNASHIITADSTNKSSDDKTRLRYKQKDLWYIIFVMHIIRYANTKRNNPTSIYFKNVCWLYILVLYT